VDFEDVQIEMEDSHDGVLDSGMFGDRCTTWSGNAVIAAAEDARSKLAEVAADMLDAKAEDLVFRDKKIFAKDTPAEAISFLRAVRNAYYGVGKSLYGSGSWSFPGAEIADFSQGYCEKFTPSFSFVAQAVEVEVDPETGKVTLLSSVAADDCGRPINPLLVEGQMDGGSAHMIGQALYEISLYNKKGVPLTGSMRTYKIPTALDVPKLTNHHVLVHDPLGPFGAKGAGETCTTAIMAAIRNAIEDAVGVRLVEPPFTPEKVFEALKAKKEGKK
jgi:CO/xanthine dehydrogenase Mo-binding subunit